MQEEMIAVVAAVLAGGVAAQWLGWRLRVPAIVFLLGGGLVAGPLSGALDPDRTFGELLFPLVSLAVALILFEGALGLGWRGVRAAGTTVWLLITIGAGITVVGTTLAARYLLDVEWDLAVLLGAVLVVTGPTVIGPIVRAIGLRGRLGAILEAEGTLIDPVGAILTVLVFEALFESHNGTRSIVSQVMTTVGVGAIVGVAAAVALIAAFSRYVVPDQLHNVATLTAVIGAFAVANGVRRESGLVAVTVMGVALASQSRIPVQHVLEFNETLRILAISALFVLLGARIEPDTLRELEWRNMAFLTALVVVVRPLCVFVATLRSGLARRERLFLALTAPRGIVAAAIASVFSLQLAEIGVENSQILVAATFTVIGGTVLISGLGSRFLATRLRLIDSANETIIVLGANPVAREFASALAHHGAPVRLVDLDRRKLATARMTGLLAHRGSVFADKTWQDAGIQTAACFVAMTSSDELNVLASRHAAAVLGRKHVFQLPPRRPEHEAWWTLPVGTFARPLFANDANLAQLAARLEEGWKVVATRLTDKFGPADYARVHPDAVPMFVVDARGNIDLVATDAKRRPRVGDTVVALVRPSLRA